MQLPSSDLQCLLVPLLEIQQKTYLKLDRCSLAEEGKHLSS